MKSRSVPLDRQAIRDRVVTPVLVLAVPARVLMPDNDVRRMVEVVAVGKRTNGQRDLLADEIELGIVRHLAHERAERKQEVCGEEPRPTRPGARLPITQLCRAEQCDRLGA